jgi:biopolymer transport protein ExbD
MMGFQHEPREESEDLFQVSAMVDVVFILLAFFVMSVQFHSGERDLPLDYKDQTRSAGASAEDLPAAIRVQLQKTEAGAVAIRVGDAALPDNGFDDLTALLTKIDLPGIPVVIDADAGLSIQQVATGIDAVLASPMKRLSMSPAPKGSTP